MILTCRWDVALHSRYMFPRFTGAVALRDITCKRDITHVTLHAFYTLTFRRHAKDAIPARLATQTKDGGVNPKIIECVKRHAWSWERTGDNLMSATINF